MDEVKPNRQRRKRPQQRHGTPSSSQNVTAEIVPAPGGRVIVFGTRRMFKHYLVELDDEPSLTITTDGKKR